MLFIQKTPYTWKEKTAIAFCLSIILRQIILFLFNAME